MAELFPLRKAALSDTPMPIGSAFDPRFSPYALYSRMSGMAARPYKPFSQSL
jgi:hypothetical protein